MGLAALLLAIYAPSLNGPYILDDTHTIAANSGVQSLSNWARIWTSSSYYSSLPTIWVYRPLTATSNLLLWAVDNGAPWPFHVFKILLFAATCSLLFPLWRKLLPMVSSETLAAGLLIFAVNPAHSQVLAYISATSTLLAGFFVTLGLFYHLKYLETQKWSFLIVSGLSVALGMMAKEEAIVAVALIPLITIYLQKISNQPLLQARTITSSVPVLMFTGLALLLIISKAEPTAQFSGGDISSWQYFMTQWRAYLRYMAMYFFSYDLNADNLQFGFSTSLRDKGVLLALIFNLAVLGLGALFWRKVPVATFAIVWFYVAITPASSVVVLSEPVNDHRAYLSYFGLFMLGAMALEQIRVRNRRVFVLVAAVLVLVYSTQTFTRAKDWGNSERLWRDTVMKNPISVRAKNNLAVELMSMARYEEALNWLDECVATGRLYANCFTNRAIVKAALGRDAEAESDFALGAQYDPSGVQARASWARFLSTRGFLQRALEQLQASDQHAGGRNFEVRMELMRTLLRMGDRNTVRSLLEESFRIFGSNERLLSFQTRYELN